MRALAVLRGRKSCGPRLNHFVQARRGIRHWALAMFALVSLAPAIAQETITYSYDVHGRLIEADHGSTGPNANVVAQYTYDPADNRCNVTVTTGTPGTATCSAVTGGGGGGGGGTSPTFSINNASANEGATLAFTVTRAGDTSGTDTVQYATANNTATAGSDYTAKSLTTLTFNPGVATQSISVATLQDTAVEGNETFYVNLSNASTGTSITDGQALGTIVDDDSGGGITLDVLPNTLPNATAGLPYSQTITAAYGTAPITFGISAGALPAGLNLTSGGALSGTASAAGTYNFTISATDGSGKNGSQSYTFGVNSSATNHPPVAVTDNIGLTCGYGGAFNLLSNDSDPDNDPLSLSSVSSNGGFTIIIADSTHGIAGVTAGSIAGNYTGSYVVSDGRGGNTTGAINVTISAGGPAQCQ